MHIVIIPGTNRANSNSFRLARLIAPLYQRLGATVDLIDLSDMSLEFLDPEAYAYPKPPVTAMVDRFLSADGVVAIVPEYNGSYPGVLKLFVDMLPYPQGWDSRPLALIGLAAGQFSALRAVEHFQQVAGYRNAHIYPRRVFIGQASKQFTDDGGLVNEALGQRLQEQAENFTNYVGILKRV